MKSRLIGLALTLILIVSFSCSDDNVTSPDDGNIPSSNETRFEAEWNEGTTYFDEADISNLIEYNEESSVIVFSGSSEKAKALEAGDIFVVHGLVLTKVSNVKEIEGNISISYLPAKLTEAI